MPVPEDQLPVLLPETVDYRGSGENPLNRDEAFLNVACPLVRRSRAARDGHAGHVHRLVVVLVPLPVPAQGRRAGRPRTWSSSWTPVEQYTGGAEHAVMHLLYSRFWTKAMRDIGLVQRERAVPAAVQPGPDPGRRRRADEQEPRQRPGPRRAGRALRRGHRPAVPDVHGPLGPGRPVEPDRDQRRRTSSCTACGRSRLDPHGRDAGDQTGGALPAGESEHDARSRMRAAAHRTLRDVTEDFEGFRWNTMVAKLMELANVLSRYRGTSVAGLPEWDEAVRLLLLMLAPAAPHITEELWSRLAEARGEAWSSIHLGAWPIVDESVIVEATYEVPIQVNGKLRDKVTVAGRHLRDRARADRPGARQGRRGARRPAAAPDHPRRRRQARQHRRPGLTRSARLASREPAPRERAGLAVEVLGDGASLGAPSSTAWGAASCGCAW